MSIEPAIFRFSFWGLWILLFFAAPGRADSATPLDPNLAKALEQTQTILNDPTKRSEVIQSSADAQNVDRALQQLTASPEQTQKIYELSSKVLGNVVTETGGDPQKMNLLLEEARKNPAAFANTFTPEQQKELSEIAAKIPPPMP